MIPAEAVEAAAKKLLSAEAPRFPWEDLVPEAKARYLDTARAALEAAAPYMLNTEGEK
jgi:hypothetical protein